MVDVRRTVRVVRLELCQACADILLGQRRHGDDGLRNARQRNGRGDHQLAVQRRDLRVLLDLRHRVILDDPAGNLDEHVRKRHKENGCDQVEQRLEIRNDAAVGDGIPKPAEGPRLAEDFHDEHEKNDTNKIEKLKLQNRAYRYQHSVKKLLRY